MKKAISLFLIVLIILTQSGCGAGKKPSKNLIQTDIENVLIEKNPYAEITSTETIKSMSSDAGYEIDLKLLAQTQYADWEYEIHLLYRNYEQGWMLDNLNWNNESYIITHMPDVETITSAANNLEAPVALYDQAIPIENGSLDCSQTNETETVILTWSKLSKLLHGEKSTTYSSKWAYDPYTDSWCFSEFSDENVIIQNSTTIPYEVDLSGSWTDVDSNSIEISDFSWDGFRVTMNGKTSTFSKIPGHPYSNEESFGWFSNGEERYIQIGLGKEKTTIQVLSFKDYGTSVTQIFYGAYNERTE